MLRLESNCEWVVELVLSHGSESDVLWVREFFQRRAVDAAKKLGDLSDTIRSVVEKEDLVAICGRVSHRFAGSREVMIYLGRGHPCR